MHPLCSNCGRPKASFDVELCNACFKDAQRLIPHLYARVTIKGYNGYVVPLDKVGQAIGYEFEDAEAGDTWTIELIMMSAVEFDALPDFAGH